MKMDTTDLNAIVNKAREEAVQFFRPSLRCLVWFRVVSRFGSIP